MHLRWRSLLAGLVMLALVSAGLAPTLHAHEADVDHPHTVVHRHTHIHAVRRHADGVSRPAISNNQLADHDEDAVWMDTQSVERAKISVANGIAGVCESVPFTIVPEGLSLVAAKGDSLPHGPPASSSRLRAPPTPSV